MITGHTTQGTIGSTGVKVVPPTASARSREQARDMLGRSERRVDIPVRKAFVRNDDPEITPPLAQLVGRGGRGGAVPVKLLIALIWRSSAAPYTTTISAQQWATLLDLEGPLPNRARRISKSLELLEELRLISLERQHGMPSVVTLLNESGAGDVYDLPSTQWVRAPQKEKAKHVYLKVPSALWLKGHIQSMSSAALAMLLVILAEQGHQAPGDSRVGTDVWWSTNVFPQRYGLSSSMRARGTKELVGRRLLIVRKQLVTPPGSTSSMSSERVRNIYTLINEAVAPHSQAPQAQPKKENKQIKKAVKTAQ